MISKYVCPGMCLAMTMAMMITLHSAEALTCYSCASADDYNTTDCNPVSSQTGKIECSDACQTLYTSISTAYVRSCGTLNTGCKEALGIKACAFSCTSNLCNTQSAAHPTSRSGPAALLLTVVALVLLRNFL